MFSARLQIRQNWNVPADFREIVQRQFHFRGVGHREQMQNGIRRAAERDDHRDCVLKRFSRHDIFWLDVFFQKKADGFAGFQTFFSLVFAYGRI